MHVVFSRFLAATEKGPREGSGPGYDWGSFPLYSKRVLALLRVESFAAIEMNPFEGFTL